MHDHILKERIPADGPVNVRFALFAQVDGLGIAPPFKVEHPVVVPAMLIIPDQSPLRIGGEGGLSRTGKPEEYGRIAVSTHIGGAVHGGDPLQGQVVVHDRENPFLHLSPVPGTTDDSPLFTEIEEYEDIGIEPLFLPLRIGYLGCVEHHEIGFEILQFLLGGPYEHVFDEMGLPGHFHDKTHLQPGILIGAAVTVHHKEPFSRKLPGGQFISVFPDILRNRFVIGAFCSF